MIGTVYALIRVMANSLSKAYRKIVVSKGVHPLFIMTFIGIVSVIPFAALLFHDVTILNPLFWVATVCASVIGLVAGVLLIKWLELTDLSIVGPIGAFSPIIVTGIALFFLHEIPTLRGFIGIIIVVLGSYLMQKREKGKGFIHPWKELFTNRGVVFYVTALVLFAAGGAVGTALWECTGTFITEDSRKEKRPLGIYQMGLTQCICRGERRFTTQPQQSYL